MSSVIDPLRHDPAQDYDMNREPILRGRIRRSSLPVERPVDRPALIKRSSSPSKLISPNAMPNIHMPGADIEWNPSIQPNTLTPKGGGHPDYLLTGAKAVETGKDHHPHSRPDRSSPDLSKNPPFAAVQDDTLSEAKLGEPIDSKSSSPIQVSGGSIKHIETVSTDDQNAQAVSLDENTYGRSVSPDVSTDTCSASTRRVQDESTSDLCFDPIAENISDAHVDGDRAVVTPVPAPPPLSSSTDLEENPANTPEQETDIPTLNLQLLCEEDHGQEQEEDQLVPVPQSFDREDLISPLVLPSPADPIFSDITVQNTSIVGATSLHTETHITTAVWDAEAGLPEIVVTSPTTSPALVNSLDIGNVDRPSEVSVEMKASADHADPSERVDEAQEAVSSGFSLNRDGGANGQSDDPAVLSSTLRPVDQDFPTTVPKSHTNDELAVTDAIAEEQLLLKFDDIRPNQQRSRAASLDEGSRSLEGRVTMKHRSKSISGYQVPPADMPFTASLISMLCLERVPEHVQLSVQFDSTETRPDARPRPRGRQIKRKARSRSQSQEAHQPRKRPKLVRSASFGTADQLQVFPSTDSLKRDVAAIGIKIGREEASAVTTPPTAEHETKPEEESAEEISFEEAQAMLTVMKRGIKLEETICEGEPPQTLMKIAGSAQDLNIPPIPHTPTRASDHGSLVSNVPSPTYSEIRSKKRKAEDDKSTRTLKKPFKTPLVKGRALKRYLGSSSPPFIADTDLLETPPSSSVVTGNASLLDKKPFPTFESAQSKRYMTKRLAKPFKSPSFSSPICESDPPSSDAIDPPSSPTRCPARAARLLAPPSDSTIAPTRASEISILETRKQVLSQALKIMNNQADEERLAQLHQQWLAAGREITEKLFTVVPEPTEEDHGQSNTNSFYQDDPKPFIRPEDEESRERETVLDEPKAKKDWNMGSMLDMFGIDPTLFGWREDQEDWQD